MYVHVYVYAYTPKHANQVGVAVSPGLLNMALAARFAASCSPTRRCLARLDQSQLRGDEWTRDDPQILNCHSTFELNNGEY